MSIQLNTPTAQFDWVFPAFDFKFQYALHQTPSEGWLTWEYNPFRNLKLSEPSVSVGMMTYSMAQLKVDWRGWKYTKTDDDAVYTADELIAGLETYEDGGDVCYDDPASGVTWRNEEICDNLYKFRAYKDEYNEIYHQAGSIVDFDTTAFHFSLNNPVQIECQHSYDGSVNLILNDNLNPPMLVNSRFTVKDGSRYEVIDRYGNNDTNIYDDDFIGSDTSLFCGYKGFPTLEIDHIQEGGSLLVGSYVFYFRFCNADGDHTDFVASTKSVYLAIGGHNSAYAQKSGYRDENSHKMVCLSIQNDRNNYDYAEVFYTRKTGDEYGNLVTIHRKIQVKYPLTSTQIIVTGSEPTVDVSQKELNERMLLFKRAKSQCQVGGRLFMANLTRTDIPYTELTRASLSLLPVPHYSDSREVIGSLNEDYVSADDNSQYYKYENVIDYTGYFPGELYRFGVVYILHDGTYTCVFPLRGGFDIQPDSDRSDAAGERYSYIDELYDWDEDIQYSETDFTVKSDNNDRLEYENVKGVCRFARPDETTGGLPLLGVRVRVTREWIDHISLYAKGYFFVRQKRMPLLLCQGIGVGVEKESGTPVLKSSSYSDRGDYILESFTNKNGVLSTNFKERLVDTTGVTSIKGRGLLVPELSLSHNYLHDTVNGNECVIMESWNKVSGDGFKEGSVIGSFTIPQDDYEYNGTDSAVTSKTFVVNEFERFYYLNDGYKFNYAHGVGGSAMEFDSISEKKELDVYEGDCQVIRGEGVPFVGLEQEITPNGIYNIYVPGYSHRNFKTYYLARVYDKSEFYPITDITDVREWEPEYDSGSKSDYSDNIIYSGDCYICQVTLRMIRNFQDTENPINDTIINTNTWHDYWYNLNHKDEEDGLSVLKNVGKALGDMATGGLISALTSEDVDNEMNTGDINAVPMGHWATFTVYSSTNLIRTEDYSYTEEASTFGAPRTFYPLTALSREGRSKKNESYILNPALGSNMSSQYYFERPDLPYIKDIFETRIAYSKLHATDGTSNKYRYFMPGQYKDYPITYGGITKIVPYGGNIVVVFEHGIGIIAVDSVVKVDNDKIVNTGEVLADKVTMLTDTYGSQWIDSVILTGDGSSSDQGAIYGVDTTNKAIWMVSGSSFKVISNACIEPFLNKNITLTERELTPVVGIRNVKTHYVHYKKDVLFTFYDHLTGFEENAWNLVYNEGLGFFTTFYSWMPSYSGNIDRMCFSFDRGVSKNISKMWYSMDNEYIFADTTLLDGDADSPSITLYPSLTHLSTNLVTKTIAGGRKVPADVPTEDVEEHLKKAAADNMMYCDYTITLERDPLGNFLQFVDPTSDKSIEDQLKLDGGKLVWYGCWDEDAKDWRRDDYGNYVAESPSRDKSYSLYVKSNVDYMYYKQDASLKDYAANLGRYMKVNAGYFEQTITLANRDCVYGYSTVVEDSDGNKSLEWIYPMSTDFWKHGNAGIIDITDKLNPANWYGKQHPFEVEVYAIVGSDVSFTNLVLISNDTEPESFHYTVNATPYSFYHDLNNMYFRQEAVRRLYQYNYHDILCDNDFIDTPTEQKLLKYRPNYPVADKSVLFPLFFMRHETYDEIEDSYQRMTGDSRNYQHLSGTEVTYDDVQNVYGMSVHIKAAPIGNWYRQELTEDTARRPKYADIAMVHYFNGEEYVDTSISDYDKSETHSHASFYVWDRYDTLRGNCFFREGMWYVQIPSVQMYDINEPVWSSIKGTGSDVLSHPILNLALNPVPGEPTLSVENADIPKDLVNLHYSSGNGSIITDVNWLRHRTEARIKGSYCKVKIRYDGRKLALLKGITTLYQ